MYLYDKKEGTEVPSNITLFGDLLHMIFDDHMRFFTPNRR